jgi:hypothetical protein
MAESLSQLNLAADGEKRQRVGSGPIDAIGAAVDPHDLAFEHVLEDHVTHFSR